MKADQCLELPQGCLRSVVLRIDELEQGEPALAVSALDALDGLTRIRDGRCAQQIDLA